ncbi:MAG: putative efflux pump outer membrane protein SepC, partial [Rhizorhabdus sp.]|nr:putative efflux pump outer membrane protein SepC [Rhizorhabdus sp.]
QLIENALAFGTDARAAYFRIREARAVRARTSASTGPSGNIAASSTVRDTDQLSGVALTGEGRTTSSDLSLQSSWEVDLFGRLENTRAAGRLEFAAASFDYHGARLALAADVADALFEARGIAVQLEDAQVARTVAADLARAGALGREHGLVSGADSARLDSDVRSAEADVVQLETALRVAKRSLLILIGTPNADIDSLVILARLDLPPPLPAVAPATLLQRRPDVRAAEYRLAAAMRSIKVDRAALFPQFILRPGAGLSDSSGILGGSSMFWSIGAGLTVPLLDRTRLIAELRVTEAQAGKAVVAYEKAVQTAFGEADNALTRAAADGVLVDRLGAAAERAGFAFRASQIGYRKGLTDLTTTLQTERAWISTRGAFSRQKAQALGNVVAVFRALGGGWTPGAPATAPGQPDVPLAEVAAR